MNRAFRFRQCGNAFLSCSDPQALQELADSLTARDLVQCGQKWLTYLTPFFTEKQRKQAGCQHRLFFSQVEYCDNLVFRRPPLWTSWENGSWMRIGPWASPEVHRYFGP